MKRLIDILVSFFGLAVTLPFMVVLCVLIWLQDFCSPFYIANRIARGGGTFRMFKLRSMVKNADKSGVNSTAGNDRRITWVGRFIRRFKFDEIPQLWNVLKGDMSLVGPRPQVEADAALYTEVEKKMLNARPGITDLASIVFSDEGDILKGSDNPDLRYNQVIRPWKSRLALLYVEKRSVWIDLKIVVLTIVAITSRSAALRGVHGILRCWGAESEVLLVARREEPLKAYPPPGALEIVASYP